jgi:hypothetical protein
MNKSDIANEAIRATPPVTVAGLTVAGVTLNDVVLIATLVYVVLQIGFVCHKWYRLYRGGE